MALVLLTAAGFVSGFLVGFWVVQGQARKVEAQACGSIYDALVAELGEPKIEIMFSSGGRWTEHEIERLRAALKPNADAAKGAAS